MSVPVLDGSHTPEFPGTDVATLATNAGFSTSAAGKVLVAIVANGPDVSSISGAGLSFSLRAKSNTSTYVELWEADSAGAITNQAITVNFAGTVTYAYFVVFGVADENDFDVNGSLPDTGTSGNGEVSTTAADSMVIGIFRPSDSETSPPTGWTAIIGINYLGVFYKTFTSPQTSLAVPENDGAPTNSGYIADAIAGVSAGASVVPVINSVLRMMDRNN